MTNNEPVMFVRHSGGGFLGDRWAQNWLFKDGEGQPRIALHYQDQASFDSSKYSTGSGRIDRFEDAGQELTIAVVAFSEYPNGEKYITGTLPGTREIVVMETDTQNVVEIESAESNGTLSEMTEEYEDKSGYKVIKTLQVEDWKSINQ